MNIIKTLGYILAATVGFFVLVVASTLGEEAGKAVFKSGSSSDEEMYGRIVSDTGLTETHRESFVKSCMLEGSNHEYCSCTFDQIKNQYTPDSLKLAAEETQKTGQIPKPITDAWLTCAHLR